ncbi:MAG: class I SAM-dependent methyltransferase [Thermodesulfobacteriota bacterium]
MPFEDGYFDFVSSFNSLDHVDDLDQAIAEITRVIAPGGLLLLITDVNHAPTKREPLEFSWDIVSKFNSNLKLVEEKHFEKGKEGIYMSIRTNIPYDHSNHKKRYVVLSAKFIKPLKHNYD